MSPRTRVTWWVRDRAAEDASRTVLEAIEAGTCMSPVIHCKRAADLPEQLRGLRQAHVSEEAVEQLCAALEQVAGVVEVEASAAWVRAVDATEPTHRANTGDSWAGGPTPDLHGHQHYLAASPRGVGVWPSQRTLGARGSGVLVVDIEAGWRLTHEQLIEREVKRLTGTEEVDDHGTAALGAIGASDNGRGIRGIVPEASLAVAYGDPSHERWNPEVAIITALDRARMAPAGGVIVLEMQLAPRPRSHMLPVEASSSTFRAIEVATSMGVHVVEAAGNGGLNLDHPRHDHRFDRRRRDSGAILVGAGGSGHGQSSARARLHFSNYGSRVDVQAWGEHVATCGGPTPQYSDLYPSAGAPRVATRCYTASFRGTSAAASLVAGCVAAILGACHRAQRSPPSPKAMRALLIETGTPQADPHRGPIGPLPNLHKALASLGL